MLVVLVVLSLAGCGARAQASEPAADHFRAGADALAVGRYGEAIAQLEAYADREPPHPDASFDRGAAYLMRVQSGAERAGDLGRAAAAFEESALMRPGDEQAHHALELVRAEVARRRARNGKAVLVATPSLDRALARLMAPRSWATLAITASWLFAIGLVLRRRREGPMHLAGVLCASIGGVALALFLPIAEWSDHLDRTTRPAVLVTKEAFLTNEDGRALGGDPITEAAHLELSERKGDLAHIRYGTREGWIPVESARILRIR